jgi:hypothetical protein
MKKSFRFFILFCLFVLIPFVCFSAGTVTQSIVKQGNNTGVLVLTFEWVGDAANGTVPNTDTSAEITKAIEGMRVYQVITVPGAVIPTDKYDIVLNDADSIDIMGGTLIDRSQTAKEFAIPMLDATNIIPGQRIVNGKITLVITNQNVASATGIVKIFLVR